MTVIEEFLVPHDMKFTYVHPSLPRTSYSLEWTLGNPFDRVRVVLVEEDQEPAPLDNAQRAAQNEFAVDR